MLSTFITLSHSLLFVSSIISDINYLGVKLSRYIYLWYNCLEQFSVIFIVTFHSNFELIYASRVLIWCLLGNELEYLTENKLSSNIVPALFLQ